MPKCPLNGGMNKEDVLVSCKKEVLLFVTLTLQKLSCEISMVFFYVEDLANKQTNSRKTKANT